MKHLLIFSILSFSLPFMSAQTVGQEDAVGIGTDNPKAGLDINLTNMGMLFPRVALTNSTTAAPVINPSAASSLAEGTVVFNTSNVGDVTAGLYYWSGARWNKVNAPAANAQVHTGAFIISSTGSQTITLPAGLNPTYITFEAMPGLTADLNTQVIGNSGAPTTNTNDYRNTYGSSTGYVRVIAAGVLQQQTIFGGGSASSINDISRYASGSHVIGIRYADVNGDSVSANFGKTRVAVTSITTSSFVINVTASAATDPVSVIKEPLYIQYTAYRK